MRLSQTVIKDLEYMSESMSRGCFQDMIIARYVDVLAYLCTSCPQACVSVLFWYITPAQFILKQEQHLSC